MEEEFDRTRERSRSRDRNNYPEEVPLNYDDAHLEEENDRRANDRARETDPEIAERLKDSLPGELKNNLYITNLSFQTSDETLKGGFERFGEIESASVIKEPVTNTSRGFGFVAFVRHEDFQRALQEMNGGELDGRIIRVEVAKRGTGYSKTPGRYLGPPQLSSRFTRDDGRGGGRGGGGGSRDYRDSNGSGDRYPPRGGGYYDRGDRGGYPPREDRPPYRGAPPSYDRPPYREERGRDYPPRMDARGDSRGRSGAGVPPYAPYGGGAESVDRRPAYYDRGARSPPRAPFDHPPVSRGGRDDRPPVVDDRRGGGAPFDRGGYGGSGPGYYRGSGGNAGPLPSSRY